MGIATRIEYPPSDKALAFRKALKDERRARLVVMAEQAKSEQPRLGASVMAPGVRRLRGDVDAERRAVYDEKTGRVTGYAYGDRIMDQIHRYAARKEITRRQFQAGEMLLEAAERTEISMPSLLDPDRIGGGGGPEVRLCCAGLAAVQAQAEIRRVVADLGIMHSSILQHVVIDGRSAGSWPAVMSKGLPALRLALDRLADHYRLPA